MKLKRLTLALFIMMLVTSLSLSLTAEANNIRLSHDMVASEDNESHAMMMVLQHYINSGTDMEAEIHPDNVLGGMESIIEQVHEGNIHIAIVSVGGMGHFYPEILMYNVDYIYPENEKLIAEFWSADNEFTASVFDDVEDTVGVKPMGLLRRGGWSVLTNSERPIRTVDDMDGLTMRAMDSSQIQLFNALGADGVSVPWEEVYTALQTGVADGQRNPATVFLDASLDEVQDYVTYPGLNPGGGLIIVNPDWYYELSDEDREVVDMALDNAFVTARGMSYRAVSMEQELLEDAGFEIYNQTEEEFNEMREVGLEGMMDWAYDEFGEDFVDEFLEEIERLEEKHSQ